MTEGWEWIEIRGARMHNLRDVSVRVPVGKITVFTGVSGSGKSSLAFDTLFAEGQCRFLESLSPGARRMLDRLPRPDVDEIVNLPPTLSVEQSPPRGNPRATVATVTELHDLLRLLYTRCGEARCPKCGSAIGTQTFEELVDETSALVEGTRVLILAPLARGEVGDLKEHFQRIRRDGFLRARLDGEPMSAETPPTIDATLPHDLDLIVDRQVIRDGVRDRLAESLATALKLGSGSVVVAREVDGKWIDAPFAARNFCIRCGHRAVDIEPNLFNFNSAVGACPDCQGLGSIDDQICPTCEGTRLGPAAGFVAVGGVSIVDLCRMTIAEVGAFFAKGAETERSVAERQRPIVEPILLELRRRLEFLNRVGVGYIELDRAIATLSGGEAHRARLAGCVAAGSVGVLYVLDEPSTGLHHRDTDRLWEVLVELRDRGNTVVVVEHDESFIRKADWVVDLGPGAGTNGGEIVFECSPSLISDQKGLTADYIAGRRAICSISPAIPGERVEMESNSPLSTPHSPLLTLHGVRFRNLNIDRLAIPLGRLICMTGVSGSGKSTLIRDVLAPAIRYALQTVKSEPRGIERLEGVENIVRLLEVDQTPLADSVRSTPATATGLLDVIRKLFAQTKIAKLRGFSASRFSFNNKPGQCAACKGLGRIAVDLVFMPDAFVLCETCEGARFNAATLAVRFKDKSIADVLAMTVDRAAEFFAELSTAFRILNTLKEVGLGYLQLGQPGNTLSGGESQRLKLAAELSKADANLFNPENRTLLILDEPTTGLHFHDIHFLLRLFRKLVAAGHSLLVIEHQRDVIAAADWQIDLGPGGGASGGRVVHEGPPMFPVE